MVATIPADGPNGVERSFRYAPLSSGLDIVRKTLGQHEIATVQTTAIDHAAGIVNVTTILAHSSGEWIASDWPVLLSRHGNPTPMGAALTYARRYALFALVGIAGEDDLDAPDLNTPTTASTSGAEKPIARKNGRLNGGQTHSAQPDNRGAKAIARPSPSMLETEASAALRDRLAAELKGIRSADEAARWAHRVLGAKSTLTAADAKQIEDEFQTRLASFDSAVEDLDVRLSRHKPPLAASLFVTSAAASRAG